MDPNSVTAMSPAQVHSWPVPMNPQSYSGQIFTDADAEDAFLKEALERFKTAEDAERKLREEMEEDHRFACGTQWPQTIQAQRHAQDRPTLSINRVPEFVSHAVNNLRQNRPMIKIVPVGDGATTDIANLRQGLVRHIQQKSKAETVFDETAHMMFEMGLSWIRVVADWANPESFDQELFIRWIRNPFTVYWDPFCTQPDWSDMKWLFIIEDLTKAEFQTRFGEDALAMSWPTTESGNSTPSWFPEGKIRIAEYFRVKIVEDKLCQLEDKTTRLFSELPKGMYFVAEVENGKPGELGLFEEETKAYVGKARETNVPEVWHYLMSARKVLSKTRWLGSRIPVLPCIGHQTEFEGELSVEGMVRWAREPQRMYNYMYSSFVEAVALTPKAPFIAEVDQIPDGNAEEWEKANQKPVAVLRYKARSEGGQLLPPPMRQPATPDIAAFSAGLQMSDANLKAVFRIYDASLGQRGPQESGLAINARKVESDTGIFNWGDNFLRCLHNVGWVLNELLPFYYNSPGKVIRILQDDDSRKEVVMNQAFLEQGQKRIYDLEQQGEYGVDISTGPSVQTLRQEKVKGMIEFFQLYPAGLQACAHVLVKEFDFPGAEKISAQLEKLLPPALQTPDPDSPPDPNQLQSQIGILTQQNQQLLAALKEASDKFNLEAMKQLHADWRNQQTQEVQLALGLSRTGSEEIKFLFDRMFSEMEQLRQQVAAGSPGTPATPGVNSPPATPTLPPTAGGQTPSVGP